MQLLIEEYPFKTMLYFLQGILYFFKWQFHALRFLTETSPSFKGIAVCMKGSPFVQELKPYHTQPYSFTRTAVCLEGYFLRGMLPTFERNIVYKCIYIYMIMITIIISYSELCFLKMILYFPNKYVLKEYRITPLFKSIFHEAIKYCLKGMPLF